jgi:hypothetical protein
MEHDADRHDHTAKPKGDHTAPLALFRQMVLRHASPHAQLISSHALGFLGSGANLVHRALSRGARRRIRRVGPGDLARLHIPGVGALSRRKWKRFQFTALYATGMENGQHDHPADSGPAPWRGAHRQPNTVRVLAAPVLLVKRA